MQQEVTHRPHGDLMDPRIMTLAAQSLAYVGRNYSGVATCYRGGQREPPPRNWQENTSWGVNWMTGDSRTNQKPQANSCGLP